jgi:anti-anti-sigma factor
MKIVRSKKGSFTYLKILGKIDVLDDIKIISDTIMGLFDKGSRKFAIKFEDATYIYSGAIAILVKIFKKIKPEGGALFVVEPNKTVRDIWKTFNLDRIIPILKDEDEMK